MTIGNAEGAKARLGRILAAGLAALALLADGTAEAQTRAEPVAGPGVTTIGNIARDGRVSLRSGPAAFFPVVAALAYGTRVSVGSCLELGRDRWCQVETADGRASGFLGARYLVRGGTEERPDGTGSDGSGPDYLAVRGLRGGDTLNVRREPSSRSPALATLREGEVVRNLGCRGSDDARWCRIRSITGMKVTGWANARYLREASRPGGSGSSSGGGETGWVAANLPAGDRLNVRTEPSKDGRIIAKVRAGERLSNLECRPVGQARWCRVRTGGGVEVTGWVNAKYLRRR